MEGQPDIELLQAEVAEDDQSFLRLLVNGVSIKYITVEPGIYTADNLCLGPTLASVLPRFFNGDLDDGLVAKHATDSRPYFARTSRTRIPGVENTWHETSVEFLEPFDWAEVANRYIRSPMYLVP